MKYKYGSLRKAAKVVPPILAWAKTLSVMKNESVSNAIKIRIGQPTFCGEKRPLVIAKISRRR